MKIAYYLPKNKITNDDLAKISNSTDFSAEQIYKKTGIKTRYIADQNELVSDMCVKASKKLFDEHKIAPDEIDFLLLCTQMPDFLQPSTAFLVQKELGLRTDIGAFDVNIACSGYTYGIAMAKGLIKAGFAKKVLLCTADLIASANQNSPMAQRILFSDSASTTLLDENNIDKIKECIFGSDGKEFFAMYRKFGGRAYPINKENFDEYINSPSPFAPLLNGPEIFIFTLREVPKLVKNILAKNSMSIDDVDYFVFHQANMLILENITKILKLPKEKVIFDIEEVGNTTSSSIPITIKRALEQGRIKSSAKVLIAGFGIGSSWSGTILTI